jgi:nitroreductase
MVPYHPESFEAAEMMERSQEYCHWINRRRTVRDFSPKPVPREVIANLLLSANAAPSGAHKQPWTFCVVGDPETKRRIRCAAEEEEYESYHGRMPEEMLNDLQPLGTDWHKPFLEIAPWLIVVFRRLYEKDTEGNRLLNYYVKESCGLACGFLLSAVHQAGLVALTHTPSPMNFLSQILQRPENEKPFLLIPVGYPAENCEVPALRRKNLDQIAVWY